MSLYVSTLSFIVGSILFYRFEKFTSTILLFFVLCVVITFLFQAKSVVKNTALLVSIFLLFGIVRAFAFQSSLPQIDVSLLAAHGDYSGKILVEPDVREKVTHYVVQLAEQNTFVRMTNGHYPQLKINDMVQFTGLLTLPENFTNETTGKTFDYLHFLEKQRIQYVVAFPKIISVENTTESSLVAFLLEAKQWFIDALNKKLAPHQAALAGGILLGTKQSLGKELLLAFQRVGLIHIVVLSGYNVTLIADAIQKVLKILPRYLAFTSSLFSIICFALITGASATTVRASAMAAVVVFAWFLRKQYKVHRALWLAALIMMIQNPMIILYDPGFQLSFVATLGLLHISPHIDALLRKIGIPNMFEIRTILSATIATQIAVAPLLVQMTGTFSLISLLSNLLVLPAIPIAMLTSFIVGIVPFSILYLPFVYVSHVLLSYVFLVATKLSTIPYAVIQL